MLQPLLQICKTNQPDRASHLRAQTAPQPTSQSTSSELTLFDEGLGTPHHETSFREPLWSNPGDISTEIMDEFIFKTLEAGTKDGGGTKRVPGTPQKKTKTSFLGVLPGQRPWASAMPSKLSYTPFAGKKLRAPQFDKVLKVTDENSAEKMLGMLPLAKRGRKSCPGDLQFPTLDFQQATQRKPIITSGPLADDSPSPTDPSPTNTRAAARQRTYGSVGLGRPSDASRLRAQHLLIRRSSSGAFSSSSEASEFGTPTRNRTHGTFKLPHKSTIAN